MGLPGTFAHPPAQSAAAGHSWGNLCVLGTAEALAWHTGRLVGLVELHVPTQGSLVPRVVGDACTVAKEHV